MDTQILEELGLTPNEVKIYLHLLKTGPTSAGPIVLRSGFNRNTVYRLLEKLIEKGFAKHAYHGKRRVYEAIDPEDIIGIFREKQLMYREKEDEFRKILPNLNKIKNKSKKRPKAVVYEGFRGLRTVWEEKLRLLEKNDEHLIMWSPRSTKQYIYLVKHFNERRVEKEVTQKIIFNEDAKEMIEQRKQFPLTEIRTTPADYITPACTEIYANRVLIALFTEEPVCIVIHHQEIAESYRQYFKHIWKHAKKLK